MLKFGLLFSKINKAGEREDGHGDEKNQETQFLDTPWSIVKFGIWTGGGWWTLLVGSWTDLADYTSSIG